MKDQANTVKTTNVLIVGVGGQGVIMVSKVLAMICQMNGYHVKQSEVHGMAKRGGSVFSHVRFGEQVWSPTIPVGEADVLLALEWAEGLRWLNYLEPTNGTFITDTQHIVPPFACLNRKRGADKVYSKETPQQIVAEVSNGLALDATTMATELGNPRASNTILLGTMSTALSFPVEEWLEVIAQFVPPKTIEINRQAFLKGREWAEKVKVETISESDFLLENVIQLDASINDDFELRLTREWCKGCDICVKMCPERCLALDAEQLVELRYPDRCTGCRVCEWLCPDFAIDVIKPSTQRESA
ncbi:MAG: 2-oxoacid:acceptor oxidoreductase family protein [Rhodospirillales bacterium]|nr:2-oxoacid:acceptor oxidoreductase family protein [Rhodospirillales bacterium]